MENEVYIHVCDGIADWEMALYAMISKTRSDFPKKEFIECMAVKSFSGIIMLR